MDKKLDSNLITLKNNSTVITNSQNLNMKLQNKIDSLNWSIVELKNAEIEYLKQEKSDRLQRIIKYAISEIDYNYGFITSINKKLLDSVYNLDKALIDVLEINHLNRLEEIHFTSDQFSFIQSVIDDLYEAKRLLNSLSKKSKGIHDERKALLSSVWRLKKLLPALKFVILKRPKVYFFEDSRRYFIPGYKEHKSNRFQN